MFREHTATTHTQCCRQCHPDDRAHQAVKCPKDCQLLHQPCGHPCIKMCHEECGLCMRGIPNVPLPCGHVASLLPCHMYVTHHLLHAISCWGVWGFQLLHAVMQRCIHTACFHILHVTCEASLYEASYMFVNSADETAVPKHPTAISARRR